MMNTPLESLVATGTKLWLDSVDPELVRGSRILGATGATSNPVIVSDLLATGRFDQLISEHISRGADDNEIAWQVTDSIVRDAQDVFFPVWEETGGNDGYVSFEVDPLLEDPQTGPPHAQRVSEYVRLGRKWSRGQANRMIKVPATAAGLDALEDLVAAGVTVNVTLIFTIRQYQQARDAVFRGACRGGHLDHLKSVYSIFVSRVDAYTQKHIPELSPQAQGMVGIANAKLIWADNHRFWSDPWAGKPGAPAPEAPASGAPAQPICLDQEIVFASTGTKRPEDPPWKYVEALAGSDIQTNPPATNDAVARSGLTFTRQIDHLPPQSVLDEIEQKVDMQEMENVLMDEGIVKFADPQKALLEMIARKRAMGAATIE